MSGSEIWSFLLPGGDDPIQLFFSMLILLLGVATLIAMFRGARPANWERRWNGSGADDLDVEHGSLNEISSAVASAGEKMADIMPGILLILGLLGTFLGLGIALDKASGILSAGASPDVAMNDLMGMMEGLGTKFKTSTWGLMAFLTLRACASLTKYDERRLRWCIGRMKVAFEQSRQAKREFHEQDRNALLSTLAQIDRTLQDQLQASRGVLEQQVQLSQRGLHTTHAALESTCQAVEALQLAVLPQLQTLNANSLDARQSLNATTTLLQRHSEQNQQQLDDSQATRASLQRFIETNSDNLSAISSAAKQMAGAAGGIGQSADQLNLAIGAFKSSVGEVLDGLKHDLTGTIDNMGDSFANNMSSISATMAQATAGISGAVSSLSENVGATMTGVQRANEQSIEIQKNAQREFLVTSGSLIENVEGMTTLVNDLRERIVSGLKAVSENGRRMVSLDRRYNDIMEKAARSAEALEQLSAHLQSMQLSSPLEPLLEHMTRQIGTLGSSLGDINQSIFTLGEGLDTSNRNEDIGQIRTAMAEVTRRLEGIDTHLQHISLESQGVPEPV